ncbi:MAG: hypothetical protein L6V85_08450 [Clostridiales bacterium]|nr:MAG: hypothetical protein L6V85_08450 [Clostridiales bacterium]
MTRWKFTTDTQGTTATTTKAEQFAIDNELIPLAGSDFHEPQDGGAGIILEKRNQRRERLVNEIRKRRHLLLKQDSTK